MSSGRRKKKRILFGAVDIGYRIEHYSKFIREKFGEELEVESFSKYVLPKTHFETSYTYTCPVQEKHPLWVYLYCTYFFVFALFRYQVFHFISGETILTRKLRRFELRMYRLFGKKVIMHFVGSDLRSEIYLAEKDEHLKDLLSKIYTVKTPINEPFQIELIRDARKFAHTILVSTPDLLDIIPEATYLPVFLDFENFDFNKNRNDHGNMVTILHSPSATITKGSDYIHEALERIQIRFPDRVQLIVPGDTEKKVIQYAMTRYHLLEAMLKSDIVIDQMLIGWFGLKAIEALALGCVVYCYIDEKYRHYLDPDCPIEHASVLELEEKMTAYILQDHSEEEKKERRKRQMQYIQRVHHIDNYTELLRNLWLD